MDVIEIYQDLYIRGDQPTTCPHCGNRTEIILDLSHTMEQVEIHVCLSKESHFFIEVKDDE